MKSDQGIHLSNSGDGGKQDSPGAKMQRVASIDAYRGIVMFLMLAEVLELHTLSHAFPASAFASWISFHTTHVQWVGCSLHDLIQPSFSFLVGVSLPFSLAVRRARGNSFSSMAMHAAWRSVLLIALGVFLRSLGKDQTNFFFVDTLTQIGLGYFALFLVAGCSRIFQWASVAFVLLGYWLLFALWPLPDSSFQWASVGVAGDWPHRLSGFASHWNKNMNPAWAFDTWFMNLFPQNPTYEFNGGGYCTLNFIPTLATMLLGTLAGGLLKGGASNHSQKQKGILLLVIGVTMFAVGWGLGAMGLCPVVKRIWTPSWVLYSGGLCYVALAALHWVCDIQNRNTWAWPLLVIGSNSIAAYVMSWTMETPIKSFLQRHLGTSIFEVFGEAWQPVFLGTAVLVSMWLILLWLYRRRVFIRI